MKQPVKTHLVLELVQECDGEVLARQRVADVVTCIGCAHAVSTPDGLVCSVTEHRTTTQNFCSEGKEALS